MAISLADPHIRTGIYIYIPGMLGYGASTDYRHIFHMQIKKSLVVTRIIITSTITRSVYNTNATYNISHVYCAMCRLVY